MSVELRYYAKADTYFIQIQAKEYLQLEKRMKRIRREINHMHNHNSEKYINLSRQMETLRKEKEDYRYYVKMNHPSEVGRKIKVRPIFHRPTNILSLTEDDYGKLIQELNRENEG